jgi:hypothetical protein
MMREVKVDEHLYRRRTILWTKWPNALSTLSRLGQNGGRVIVDYYPVGDRYSHVEFGRICDGLVMFPTDNGYTYILPRTNETVIEYIQRYVEERGRRRRNLAIFNYVRQ